jgi:NADH:ubiquinone oxidoreductase subunit 5 (subunit L)/multisubunit Na+/H+ antiporter MnhA subunit
MILPLVVLAIGAVVAGYLNWPKEGLGHFLSGSPSITHAYNAAHEHYRLVYPNDVDRLVDPAGFGQAELNETGNAAEHSPFNSVMLVSALISVLGILLAYQLHLKDRAAGDRLPERFAGVSRLLEGKYWIDEIYQAAIVEPLRKLGKAFFLIDQIVVDGFVWLMGFIPQASGFTLKLTTQRGYLQGYAAAMLFGVAVILLAIFW